MTTPSEHPYDWNAKLVRFFLKNSRLVWLLLIALLVGGTVSILSLRREGFPEISPKMAIVSTVLPGATAEEVESQVTGVIENAVKDVKGLKQTSSTSSNSYSSVMVTFDESVDLDSGVQDVQSKVQAARSELPTDAEAPSVRTFSTGGPSFLFGITRPESDLDTIRKDAELIASELSDVSGVKSARQFHEIKEQVTVRFRPGDLARTGVTLQALQLALQGSNVNFPVGTFPVDGKEESVISVGAFSTLDQVRDLIVGVNVQTRQPIRLRNVADVDRGFADTTTIERFGYSRDGSLATVSGVLLSVDVTADADIIRTREEITKHLDERQADGSLSRDIVITPLYDQAKSTANQIDEIIHGAIGAPSNLWLLGGLQLLFVAMLLFVNWRSAFVAALAIPISLLFTFLALWMTGVQLNTIVLFSLILVLGLIVDPAIVMVEAIQRYRDLRYGKDDAVLESGRRYGASLFMAVLTSVIVFVPFGVVSGIFGQIIKYIPLTVVPALIASYLVPIAILPLLTKWFIRPHRHTPNRDEKAHEIEGLSRAAEWVMSVNRAILAKRWKQITTLVVGFALVGLSLSLLATGKVQSVQFSTPEDNPNLSINATFAKALTPEQRSSTAGELEALLREEPGVENYLYFSQSRDGVYLYIELKPKAARGEGQGSKAIRDRLRAEVETVANLADVVVSEVGIGTPESDYQISSQLYANDPAILEAAAKDVGAFLAKQSGVIKVDDGFSGRGEPKLSLVLDRMKVQTLGLSSFEIGQQLKAAVEPTKVTKYTGEGGAADLYLESAEPPTTEATLLELPLVTRAGQVIRLRDVATAEPGTSVDAIQRFDGQRFVNIRARVDGNTSDVFVVQKALNEYLTNDKLASLGIDANESRGEFDEISKSFQELGVALVIAIILTYIVLVLQFASFSQPLVMLVTVPLSFIGVFPALWLTGSDLGFLELLGVTILVGIVENVAIFLIDYANQLVRERGLSPRDAIIQATGVRFRPILLTKLVALGGLLPLAIESDFWRGLSVTIIAGIGLSGFFSLAVIPILYTWIEGLRAKFHQRHRAT